MIGAKNGMTASTLHGAQSKRRWTPRSNLGDMSEGSNLCNFDYHRKPHYRSKRTVLTDLLQHLHAQTRYACLPPVEIATYLNMDAT
jgi:hypothetical protein